MEVFEKIIERLKSEVNYNDGAETGLNQSIEIVNQAAAECKKTLHETMIELLSGAWVDSDKVQAVFGLDFTECLSLLDFSRTAGWWSIAGKTVEERAREGQKIETRFRLKNNNWIPCTDRLPNLEEYQRGNGRFLVTDGNRAYEAEFDIYESHTFGRSQMSTDWFVTDNCVTHWQNEPLPPEPYQPKGENNENS